MTSVDAGDEVARIALVFALVLGVIFGDVFWWDAELEESFSEKGGNYGFLGGWAVNLEEVQEVLKGRVVHKYPLFVFGSRWQNRGFDSMCQGGCPSVGCFVA